MKKLIALVCLVLSNSLHTLAQNVLQTDMALKYLVQLPAEKSQHTPVIILLHGYGSDEKDLFELRSAFPKNYLIVAARAPYALPGGGCQWYDIAGSNDGKREQINNSREVIMKFIGQVVAKYKAESKEVYVMGFSQGAIMSYEVGLTAPDKIKGIGVLSGKIYAELKPSIKVTPALKRLKIFIAHGTVDERIPFADGKAANDYLKGLGLTADFHQYAGMSHSISNDVVNDLLKWLK